ncbi:hypothetical protein BDBG_03126 [Blastomyces gilchristii SLH14081]|uniref:Uncharacterized protein n=1 Tax=Blastomyces gilchristii (strain SLH14081) TaxID=559298 RepID=A0A179UIF3_BLAGS|nr:uncharacterized protein BDBG_03126 [Blastomyces gilchristii SLH14081]OAT07019.1 hypothetical protein BDBG_03126 [Blastomyces gilchristii SLH14081]
MVAINRQAANKRNDVVLVANRVCSFNENHMTWKLRRKARKDNARSAGKRIGGLCKIDEAAGELKLHLTNSSAKRRDVWSKQGNIGGWVGDDEDDDDSSQFGSRSVPDPAPALTVLLLPGGYPGVALRVCGPNMVRPLHSDEWVRACQIHSRATQGPGRRTNPWLESRQVHAKWIGQYHDEQWSMPSADGTQLAGGMQPLSWLNGDPQWLPCPNSAPAHGLVPSGVSHDLLPAYQRRRSHSHFLSLSPLFLTLLKS